MSRSSTISACGWSILVSMIGGNANIPLAVAFFCSSRAISRISCGSAVEARMNSTGKFPPPGNAGGVTGNMFTPAKRESCCATSGRISFGVRSRSLHGLSTMPPKPEVGWVSWKV